ncbi:MAG TPA: hypothetical protein VNW92_04950, partial [Polyangiaceae bacterium]|nr:hypothetical protein [Polyangiaceae bacterium]
RYGYTSCKMAKAGLNVIFHILPKTIIDPYFGFDFGIQGTFARYRSFDPTTGLEANGNDNNAAIQPSFQLGVDSHPIPALSAGIFAQGGPDFGSEGRPNDNDNGNSCAPGTSGTSGNPCTSTCSSGSCNGSESDPGSHFLFGVRVAYTFP